MRLINQYRASLDGDIDYTERQHHSLMEYIYIDFMEPSLERVAEEWGLTVAETASILQGLPTHANAEWGFENLYDRKDIDVLAPYEITEVPESSRELSVNEPNFFSGID